jgi:hypothetical protein
MWPRRTRRCRSNAAALATRPSAATPSAQGRGGRSGVHGGGRVRPRRKTVPQSHTSLTDHRSQSQSPPTSARGLSTRNGRACHSTAAAGRWHYGNRHAGTRPACALAQYGIGRTAVTLHCTHPYEAATAGVTTLERELNCGSCIARSGGHDPHPSIPRGARPCPRRPYGTGLRYVNAYV